MPDETPIPEKKLHIDEDWKSQVEAEKAAARDGGQAEDSAASRPAPTADQAAPLPPASPSPRTPPRTRSAFRERR